jgi:hypothetical protein
METTTLVLNPAPVVLPETVVRAAEATLEQCEQLTQLFDAKLSEMRAAKLFEMKTAKQLATEVFLQLSIGEISELKSRLKDYATKARVLQWPVKNDDLRSYLNAIQETSDLLTRMIKEKK